MNLAFGPANRYCLLLFFFFTSFQLMSQAPVQSSAVIFPGPLGETVNCVTTDAAGNSYYTGMFSGAADFDPGVGVANLTSNGAVDIFVLKLDASGGLVWARSFGSEEFELGASVQSDALGNVYVTGNFSNAMDVDPGAGSFILNSNGLTDVYVVKLDAFGNFLWGKAWGGAGSDGGSRVQVDSSNNVYVVGTFSETVAIDSATLVSAGGEDVFLIKMDTTGDFEWAGCIGGPNYETVEGLDVDALGNVYFGGILVGDGDLDPGIGVYGVSAPSELEQGYIVKVNGSGRFLWAKIFTGNEGSRVNELKLDPAGNLYCLGGFKGIVDLDSLYTSQGDQDIFLLKLDSSGKISQTSIFGGATQDFALGLFVDATGENYVAGTFSSTVDFDPGVATAEMTAAGLGTFLLKLDSSGNYVYASQIEGTFVRTMTDLCAVGGNVYVTGNFSESVVFADSAYYSDGLAPDGVIFVYSQSVALPFVFIRFDASLNNQHAQLEWITHSERNVSHFIVERSVDSNSYTSIAQQVAKNARSNQYQYTDPKLLSGTAYYRLKAVGVDGSFVYSQVRTLTVQPMMWVKVYPNPAHGALIINTFGLPAKGGRVTVEFYNSVGVRVRALTVLPATSQVVRLDGIREGRYTMRMTADGFSYTTQVIIR